MTVGKGQFDKPTLKVQEAYSIGTSASIIGKAYVKVAVPCLVAISHVAVYAIPLGKTTTTMLSRTGNG